MPKASKLEEIIRAEVFHEDTFSDLERFGCPRCDGAEQMLSAIVSILTKEITNWILTDLLPKERNPATGCLSGSDMGHNQCLSIIKERLTK